MAEHRTTIDINDTGPCGDQRRLRIVVADDTIEVRNIDLPDGENLQVRRPLYGYERQLAKEVERLRAEREISKLGATWQPPDTAPIDGEEFLAELSNGWVMILHAGDGVRHKWRYSWWVGQGASIPYEPSHPKDQDWEATHTIRLTGWMLLPKSRQRLQREAETHHG